MDKNKTVSTRLCKGDESSFDDNKQILEFNKFYEVYAGKKFLDWKRICF